jgi:putative membrane protein
MTKLLNVFVFAGVLTASPVLAISEQGQPPASKPPSRGTAKPQDTKTAAASPDSAFVREAASGGMAEVELGQLAAQNAESSDVKQFGQRMVDDHGKANDELKQLASQKKIDLPADSGAKHKALHDKLAKLKGAAFDKAYMSAMVSDHKEDVSAFQREAKGGKDPDVKAWAEKTLPTLQDHLKAAQDVNAKVAKAGAKRP